MLKLRIKFLQIDMSKLILAFREANLIFSF